MIVKNLENLREQNLSTVIRLISHFKVCSRAELVARTGLQQSTITNIVNALIECGLVMETGIIEGKKGRRSIGVTLNKDKYQVIGVRLSRNSYSVSRFFIDGSSDASINRPFDPREPKLTVFNHIKADIHDMISSSRLTVAAIGVAVPGPFKVYESRFLKVSYMSGMENIDLRQLLEDNFTVPVFVEHDANAGIMAEKWFGTSDLESGTYVYIAAGHGIGAGIINDGKIFHGNIGVAGEIGHMSINFNGPKCACGNVGCLEMYSSAHAVSEYVKREVETLGKSTLAASYSYEDILEAYMKDDPVAVDAINNSADYLSVGIANIMNIYNPSGIIIGDKLSNAGQRFLDRVKEKVKTLISPDIYETTGISLSSFSQDAALVGAGALAIDKSIQYPRQLISLLDRQ